MRRLRIGTALKLLPVAVAALAGCAVGPDYVRPKTPAPEHYTEGVLPAAVDSAASAPASQAPQVQRLAADQDVPARWWEAFKSPALDALVRASIANNPNIPAAQAALRAAHESVLAQRGAYWPTVGLDYSASRQRIADTLASPASSGASVYNLHTLQLTVSYTPDVFGSNRRQVESLQAQADSQRWEAEATYLTLTSNVAAAAVQEAALRGQIQATRELIDIQTEILKRFQRQYQLGQVALADVTQQEAALAAVQATLPPLDKQLALQRDLIKALAGQLPSEHQDAEFTLDSLSLPAELPLTLPSSLVDHRPDVLAAEEQLHAASAGIGVARAARLPSVQLGVNAYGSAAYSIPDLFKAGTMFWTLAGGVAQTVFDGGTLRHREAASVAAYDQAAAQYRATVINAYQNVADALQAIQADAQALRSADYAQDAADRSLAIARRQLALGDVSPMFVMQAEQAALQARLSVVQARANRLSDSVALFQALGGGWWNRQESLTQAPQ